MRRDGMRRDRGMAMRRAAAMIALAGGAVSVQGCSWFTAFAEQPKIDPWEVGSFPGKTLLPSRGNPQLSVPITGTFVSGLQVSYSPLPGSWIRCRRSRIRRRPTRSRS